MVFFPIDRLLIPHGLMNQPLYHLKTVMCQVFYLIRKGINYVMVGERQFTLLPGSVLHDAKKKPLTLQEITLPCHASLCYYLKPNRRDAYLVSLYLMPEK
jgi:hypothetical protein